MTYIPAPSPEDFFGKVILPLYPKPEDLYEQGLWSADLARVFRELALELEGKYTDTINTIFAENLLSEEYIIETPITFIRSVNVAKLRERLPLVFEKIAYVKASDAEKILGRKMLYDLCKETSPARVPPLEQVNLSDMEKALTSDEVREFVKIFTKSGIPVIKKRDEL